VARGWRCPGRRACSCCSCWWEGASCCCSSGAGACVLPCPAPAPTSTPPAPPPSARLARLPPPPPLLAAPPAAGQQRSSSSRAGQRCRVSRSSFPCLVPEVSACLPASGSGCCSRCPPSHSRGARTRTHTCAQGPPQPGALSTGWLRLQPLPHLSFPFLPGHVHLSPAHPAGRTHPMNLSLAPSCGARTCAQALPVFTAASAMARACSPFLSTHISPAHAHAPALRRRPSPVFMAASAMAASAASPPLLSAPTPASHPPPPPSPHCSSRPCLSSCAHGHPWVAVVVMVVVVVVWWSKQWRWQWWR